MADPTRWPGNHQRIPPTLVGRAPERRLLRECLAQAAGGHGRLVLIGGEAGIGKTTLAADLEREATAHGALVLAGHCYDLTATPPYGPWLDLAASYRSGDGCPPLPEVLVDGGIETISSQAALFAQVRGFFAAVAAVRPTLVILEDAHWADPASLELLRHLASQLRSLPLLLLTTYRVDELTRHHPLYQLLPSLVREAEGLRLDLRRLEVADLRALVATHYRLRPTDEDRLVAYLECHAEGNPFYATELLRTLAEEAILTASDDGWTLGELDRIVLPPLLRQVIDGRVARLGEQTRTPLALAAVIGQEVPLDLWSEVAGIPAEELLAIVEQSVDAHLLAAAPDGTRVRFVHALTREALYESVLPPRRRLWHRQVGDALAALPFPNPDAVAYHLQQAGESRAWEWLVRAGERAQRAYAWLTAVERFATAAALLAGVAGWERQRGWLLLRCGRLQRYSRASSGITDLAEAERLANVVGDRTLAAEAHYSRGLLRCFADDFRVGLTEIAAGVAALEALPIDDARASVAAAAWLADALPATEPDSASDIDPAATYLSSIGVNHRRGTLPWFLAAAGRLEEARAIGEAFLARVAESPPAHELVLSATGHTHQGLGIVHATLGHVDAACEALARARKVYGALDHHAVIAFTLLCELRDVVLPYRTTEVEARRLLAAEAEAALRRAGGAFPAGVSPRRAWMGVLFLEGEWAAAREIAADTPTHGTYSLRREITSVLAPLARHQGDADLAWAFIRTALPQGPATEPGGAVFHDALLFQRLAADLELDRRYPPGARAWLEANDRWLAWNGSLLGRADNAAGWARYALATGDLDGARTCATQAVRLASEPCQPLALLTAHRLAAQVALAAGDAAEAEHHLASALALADACAAPFERALTLLLLAELRVVALQLDEAANLLAEVRALCTPLDAQPTLAQVETLTGRIAPGAAPPDAANKLSPRELEVLRLVAQGLTDAAVADRLSISPRTVSHHLSSIYAKLDVSSRAAATRFAIEHRLS